MSKKLQKSSRKTVNEFFLSIAKTVSEQSTCPRGHVGAVLVNGDNNRVVGTGYSGSIPGAPHCEDVGCLIENNHCRRTVHAEMNALLSMNGNYSNLHLYCTHHPCYQCLKALITSNVKKIVYLKDYDDGINRDILKELPQERRPAIIHFQP